MITTRLSNIVNNLYIQSLNLKTPEEIANALYNSTIEQRCEVAGEQIFDFNFETPSLIDENEFKKYLGTVFCQYYYNFNNAFETEAMFFNKLQAITKIKMPGYAKKIDILVETNSKSIRDNIIRETESSVNANSENRSNGQGRGIYSDYPQRVLSAKDYTDIDHASTGDYSENSSQSENNSQSEGKTTETITSGSSLANIEKFSYIENVIEDLLKEYSKCFSMLWY